MIWKAAYGDCKLWSQVLAVCSVREFCGRTVIRRQTVDGKVCLIG
jgi:hypothetical protein